MKILVKTNFSKLNFKSWKTWAFALPVAVALLLIGYFLGLVLLTGATVTAAITLTLGLIGTVLAGIFSLLGMTSAAAAITGFFTSVGVLMGGWLTSIFGYLASGPIWALLLKLWTWVYPIFSYLAPVFSVGNASVKIFNFLQKIGVVKVVQDVEAAAEKGVEEAKN